MSNHTAGACISSIPQGLYIISPTGLYIIKAKPCIICAVRRNIITPKVCISSRRKPCISSTRSAVYHQGEALYLITPKACIPPSPSRRGRATADCQASATPKNASKGDFQPKHFFGLRLIDKTIFCKVSLSKE